MKAFFLTIAASVLMTGLTASNASDPPPPRAKQVPHADTRHGDLRVDQYRWLQDKSNPEVMKYLDEENRYTDQQTERTRGLQAELFTEMKSRSVESDVSVGDEENGYTYFSRLIPGKQHAAYFRQKKGAPEEMLVDLNEIVGDSKYIGHQFGAASPDGSLYAYSIDHTGSLQGTLYLKNLATQEVKLVREKKLSTWGGIAWSADGRYLFYVEDDETQRPYRLYRHEVGSSAEDALIYEEKDTALYLALHQTADRKFFLLRSWDFDTQDIRYLPTDQPTSEFKQILPKQAGHLYEVEHHSGYFYIVTNRNAIEGRLVKVRTEDPSPSNWIEVLPYREDRPIKKIVMFKDFYVVVGLEEGQRRLTAIEIKTGKSHRIPQADQFYSIYTNIKTDFESNRIRYAYQSHITPMQAVEYDLKKRVRRVLKSSKVPNFDPDHYETSSTVAISPDGTRVPISLFHRKGLVPGTPQPLLLWGHGSYGHLASPEYDLGLISLADRGVIVATAHIRGGGEFGQKWYRAGKVKNKKNTFVDFIAAAEHLVKEKYTTPRQLAITGMSAGGLVIGNAVIQRPDLFKAAVAAVPFVDILNTMLDPTLPLVTFEYTEWGNPNVADDYFYIKSYCPYTMTPQQDYPAMLVTGSLNDSQVMYWEPVKWVAKLRTMKTDENPLLLRIRTGSGHVGSSGVDDSLREKAFEYAFILDQIAGK